jgi:hypothetical protein
LALSSKRQRDKRMATIRTTSEHRCRTSSRR